MTEFFGMGADKAQFFQGHVEGEVDQFAQVKQHMRYAFIGGTLQYGGFVGLEILKGKFAKQGNV